MASSATIDSLRSVLTIGSLPEQGVRRVGVVNIIGLRTLCAKEIRRFMKVWTQTVAAPAITTSLFMAIFVWAMSGSGRAPQGVSMGDFLAPGLMMMAVIQNAFQNPLSSIVIGKVQGVIADVLMPPLSAMELIIGYVAGGLARGLALAVMLAGIFYLWPGITVSVSHWWAVLFHVFAAGIMLSLLGILTGVWAEKFDHSSAITNFVVVPLSLLSGTFYTIDRLPDSLQLIATYNPFFYLIDGFRYGFIGRADSDLLTGVIMLVGVNVFLAVLAHQLIKRGYKLRA